VKAPNIGVIPGQQAWALPNLMPFGQEPLLVPIPLESEQHTIVAFLDRETEKIDALVAKKERLIELLQEKRTALITHAVTKGLDPDVPMRDSCIAWLGEIPAHWEMCHLRRVIEKFVDYRGKTPEKILSGIPLITGKNIKNQMIDLSLSEEFISEDLYAGWMVRGLPEVGDVLVTTEAPLGKSAQIRDSNIALAQRIILLKAAKAKVTNDYLKYHFASNLGKSELLSKATGSTALGKASHFKATLITIPPINEQKRITHHIDGEIEKIDGFITKIREGIERLREFRTALISAAVTGKIDVREEVA
jgi:type I restriction enzyme, S subunit